jgi:O-Antigen ligase
LLASRERDGLILLLLLVLANACLVVGARRLRRLEEDRPLSPEGVRWTGRILVSLVAVVVVLALLAVAFSERGLTGNVSHAWHSFTAARVTSNTDPQRLLSANSENRWVWWKEAAGAFSDKPIAGWGAGSFPVVHLLYRRNRLSVNQPHSVPLQFLSETGLIGTALATLAFALLLGAGIARVRSAPSGSQRLIASALLGGVVMFLVHSLYDWDWDIPGTALPALIFLGVLCGTPAARSAAGFGYLTRACALAGVTFCACVFALSAVLPSLAATKASQAIVQAAGSPSDVTHAESTARLAARLDPLSDAGLLVEATIAARRGQLERVRSLLMSATRRNPSDVTAWFQLSFDELSLGDRQAARQAGRRALSLDPFESAPGALTAPVTGSSTLVQTPPRDSATAVPLRSHP